jgi:hypothetical protein
MRCDGYGLLPYRGWSEESGIITLLRKLIHLDPTQSLLQPHGYGHKSPKRVATIRCPLENRHSHHDPSLSMIECHQACHAGNTPCDGFVRTDALSRIFQHVKPNRSLVSCPWHNIADNTAGLQLKRGEATVGSEQLRRDLLEIGKPSSALLREHPQDFRCGRCLAELISRDAPRTSASLRAAA